MNNIGFARRNTVDRELKYAIGPELWGHQVRWSAGRSVNVLERILPLAMDLCPETDVDGLAIGRHVNQMNEVLKRNQAVKYVMRARDALDLQKIVGIRIAPGERNVAT